MFVAQEINWQADTCKEITSIIGNNSIVNILFPINFNQYI